MKPTYAPRWLQWPTRFTALQDLWATGTAPLPTATPQPGGRLVLELVADLPAWHEYSNQTRLKGWRAGGRSHVTLIESVRQDRAGGLTLFEQEFVERRGRAQTSRRFALAFRTLSVAQMAGRLHRAGLRVTARLGSYEGDPWTKTSETVLRGASESSTQSHHCRTSCPRRTSTSAG